MTLSDFVIPATEATCSFELRDEKFLDALATKVQQKVQSRTVGMRTHPLHASSSCETSSPWERQLLSRHGIPPKGPAAHARSEA